MSQNFITYPSLVAVLSLLTFFAYGIDKYLAIRGGYRISERNLHLLALFGGWPGAWLAQQLFRHKTSKRDFQLFFWLTVVINIVSVASTALLLTR